MLTTLTFTPIAAATQAAVAFAVTGSFTQSLVLCFVGGLLVALGQILSSLIAAREARATRLSVEEAKELNHANRKILDDIRIAQGLAKRRTDGIDLRDQGQPPEARGGS